MARTNMSELSDSRTRTCETKLIDLARHQARQLQTSGAPDHKQDWIFDQLQQLPGYHELHLIGSGAQGTVYKAIQESTNRVVAIKLMQPSASAEDMQRFRREIKILTVLSHPHIVTIHDAGIVHEYPYLVMEYISGLPVDKYVTTKRVSITETLELFATICDAVNAAHGKGIVHRDLKPANILIDREGEPRVLDFGLARMRADDSMTATGQFLGSLSWASPEQLRGQRQVDARSDVYALGIVLYQLLCGRLPFDVHGGLADVLQTIIETEPTSPNRVCRTITNELNAIVLKCLEKDARSRYENAGDIAADIRSYLAGETVGARGNSPWYRFTQPLRRNARVIVVGMALGLTIAVSTYYSLGPYIAERVVNVRTPNIPDSVVSPPAPYTADRVVSAPTANISYRVVRAPGGSDTLGFLIQRGPASWVRLVYPISDRDDDWQSHWFLRTSSWGEASFERSCDEDCGLCEGRHPWRFMARAPTR